MHVAGAAEAGAAAARAAAGTTAIAARTAAGAAALFQSTPHNSLTPTTHPPTVPPTDLLS